MPFFPSRYLLSINKCVSMCMMVSSHVCVLTILLLCRICYLVVIPSIQTHTSAICAAIMYQEGRRVFLLCAERKLHLMLQMLVSCGDGHYSNASYHFWFIWQITSVTSVNLFFALSHSYQMSFVYMWARCVYNTEKYVIKRPHIRWK